MFFLVWRSPKFSGKFTNFWSEDFFLVHFRVVSLIFGLEHSCPWPPALRNVFLQCKLLKVLPVNDFYVFRNNLIFLYSIGQTKVNTGQAWRIAVIQYTTDAVMTLFILSLTCSFGNFLIKTTVAQDQVTVNL